MGSLQRVRKVMLAAVRGSEAQGTDGRRGRSWVGRRQRCGSPGAADAGWSEAELRRRKEKSVLEISSEEKA